MAESDPDKGKSSASELELIQKLKEGAEILDRRSVSHQIFNDVKKEVLTRISLAPRGTVFILVGIAGVGTTRIAKAVREDYRRNSNPFNPYSAIEVAARAPISSKFGWKKFFAGALTALDEPVLGQKRRASESIKRFTTFTETAQFRGPEDYRNDLENALMRRGCEVISVLYADFFLRRMPPDEFPHVLQFFDQLVSVCRTPRVALLSGRAALLQMIAGDSRGDLCVEVIEVPPLEDQSETGVKVIVEMLAGFEALIPQILPPETLVKNAQEISTRTVGATGWVKRALTQAISDVLLLERPRKLTWSDIKRRLPSTRVTEQLKAELKEIADWLDYLKSGDRRVESKATETDASEKKKHKRRPGERGPSRDPVGGNGE